MNRRDGDTLKVLILGGTGFIGPHFVRAAAERGHAVTVFNRGKSRAELPAGVEHLIGDRSELLAPIQGRDWDEVVDLATYVPAWVRRLGEALHGHVGHYTFISTIGVYRELGGTDEDSPLAQSPDSLDPYSLTNEQFLERRELYGPLKVVCEEEAELQFSGRVVVMRPCYIVGPGDPVGALPYLAARIRAGGEILVSGDPRKSVQWVDVRDIAEWAMRLAESGGTGIFNTVSPVRTIAWGEMLEAIRDALGASATFTWIPAEWLKDKLPESNGMSFWVGEGSVPEQPRIANGRALANGFTCRPLEVTVADTLAWYDAQPNERRSESLYTLLGRGSLEVSMAREKELLEHYRAS